MKHKNCQHEKLKIVSDAVLRNLPDTDYLEDVIAKLDDAALFEDVKKLQTIIEQTFDDLHMVVNKIDIVKNTVKNIKDDQ